MKLLVEFGVDVHAQTVGSTALHIVAQEGHLECVQALVGLHADVLALDARGTSPLKLASLNRHTHVVQFLAACVTASASTSNALDANNDSTECASQDVMGEHGDELRNQRLPKACAVCAASQSHGGGKLLMCADCRVVRHCSTDCQKIHWRSQHKEECRRGLS